MLNFCVFKLCTLKDVLFALFFNSKGLNEDKLMSTSRTSCFLKHAVVGEGLITFCLLLLWRKTYSVSLSVVIIVILIIKLVLLLESLLMAEIKLGNASVRSDRIP